MQAILSSVRLLPLLICPAIAAPAFCQQSRQVSKQPEKPPADTLTLNRVYHSGEFRARSYSGTWTPANRYLRWERSRGPNGGQDLVAYAPQRDGAPVREVVLESKRLVPNKSTQPLSVSSYALSQDRSKVLIYTNTKRVWRRNTRGDYWVLDRSSHELNRIGANFPPSTLMFAKFSPDGQRVAFVQSNNLWVQEVKGRSEPRPLTNDGSETIINGTFDWVYEEELGLRDGFRWSPDSSTIAYWQLDTSGVPRFPLVNNTAGLYPEITRIPYPKTGQRNSSSRIGIVPVGAAQPSPPNTHWLKIPGDPRNNYLARMEWQPESHHLIIQQLNRLQNRNRIYQYKAATQELRELLVEKDDAWVEIQDSLTWHGNGFLWLSERSGWRQLYRFDIDTQTLNRLTIDFDADVMSLAGASESRLYFLASPDNATQSYLYSVVLDESGAPLEPPTRLTPRDQPGSHRYNISPDGKWAIHSWSQFDVPATTNLLRLPSHDVVKVLEDNQALKQKLEKLGKKRPVTELFTVEIEKGVSLDGWCIRPRELTPDKKYPLLVYVYGEPAGTTVRDSWGGSTQMWHRMLAQQGYVVMSFDNRGTPAAKGRDWRKACYRQVGILAPADQAAAVGRVLQERPYLDAQRVGVWGWSGGGSMTLNALFKHPDLYKMGISIAPVPNQRLYDTIYQERYMGLPSDNAQGYHDGSPLNFAAKLKGDLLLIHGTGDDNCHYQGAEALINELVRHNKPFRLMSYPNRSHSIREGVNTSRHLRELMTRFIHEKLAPGPR